MKYQNYIIFFLIVAASLTYVRGQNLIIDSSFESIECPDNPINSFDFDKNWYTTGADAYLISFSCPYDKEASASITALKPTISYAGSKHFSFESILSASGFLLSEGVGTELQKPLKQDTYYYFDMAFMNYEDVISNDFINEDCDPLIDRAMHVLLGEEKIYVTGKVEQTAQGLLIADILTNGNKILSTEKKSYTSSWISYWDCFKAGGGETDLAVIGEFKRLNPLNSCNDSLGKGFVYQTGHAVDEVRLYEIPNLKDTIITICKSEELEIDLKKMFNAPFTEKADFSWENGSQNPVRNFLTTGIFNAKMILPCVTVPITINIEEIICKPNIFVANIFTPNNDGTNDVLYPYLFSDLTIDKYSFVIYDRWGSKVFETEEIDEGWSGDFNGKAAAKGVYLWSIRYSLEGSEEEFIEYGDVLRQ